MINKILILKPSSEKFSKNKQNFHLIFFVQKRNNKITVQIKKRAFLSIFTFVLTYIRENVFQWQNKIWQDTSSHEKGI